MSVPTKRRVSDTHLQEMERPDEYSNKRSRICQASQAGGDLITPSAALDVDLSQDWGFNDSGCVLDVIPATQDEEFSDFANQPLDLSQFLRYDDKIQEQNVFAHIHGLQGVDPAYGGEEALSVTQDEEDDMLNLLEQKQVEPPSSVVQAHERTSNSAEEYDSRLQYSPTGTASSSTTAPLCSEPFLDSEVDWTLVTKQALQDLNNPNDQPDIQSFCPSTGVRTSEPCLTPRKAYEVRPHIPFSGGIADVRLRPFKTFFHVQEMLRTKEQMFRNSPDVVFELFARVVHSVRENIVHKQYFQFRDLFKDNPPYLSGALPGWSTGDRIDCRAREFLRPQGIGTKCFCRCKLVPDQRSVLGWAILVEEICMVTWKEIGFVMDHLGRNDLDDLQLSSGR